MTEVTETTKPERYVRPKFVVDLYKKGITDMEELIKIVSAHEASVKLRKNVKHPRDHFFYKRNIHWALSDATKLGEIDYAIKRRKPKTKKTEEQPTQDASVNNTSSEELIPTL